MLVRQAHPYQAEAFACGLEWIKAHHVMAEMPTGSGKTTLGLAMMAWSVGPGRPFSHGIIAAPQVVIERGFLPHHDETLAGFDESPIVASPRAFRTAGEIGRSVRAIIEYLGTPCPGYVLTCTHQALAMAFDRDLDRAAIPRGLLFLDEAHHAPAAGLARVVRSWSDGGGRIIFATATPFRADRKPVGLDGMMIYRRSLGQQMEEGFAPATVTYGVVPISCEGDAITKDEFYGLSVSRKKSIQDEFVARMCEEFAEAGCPKLVIRVPVLRGGSGPFARRLVREFARLRKPDGTPVRVLDATGTTKADQARTIEALGAERGRPFGESRVDVIVGIQRVKEGLDWPHCSTVYSVGIPGSIPETMQLLGRAMRLKGEDHDSRHRDLGTIQFFTPGADRLGDSRSRIFARHAAMTCLCLDDVYCVEQLRLENIVRQSLTALGGERAAPMQRATAEGLTPEQVVQVKAIMAAEAEDEDTPLTVRRLLDAVARSLPGIAAASVGRIAAAYLLSDPSLEADAEHRIRDSLARGSRTVDEAIGDVLDEFQDRCFVAPAGLNRFASVLYKFTGQTARDLAGKCFKTAEVFWYGPHEGITVADVANALQRYHDRYARFPNERLDYLSEPDSIPMSWGSINRLFMARTVVLRRGQNRRVYVGGLETIIRVMYPHYQFNRGRASEEWPVTSTVWTWQVIGKGLVLVPQWPKGSTRRYKPAAAEHLA